MTDLLRTGTLVLHVAADMVWIGSILGVAVLLNRTRSAGADAKSAAESALFLYTKLATPAFVAAFCFGLARLVLDLRAYFVLSHFMHAKLTFALAVIALHHVIGARAKRLVGQAAPRAAVAPLAWALMACAGATIYFAVFKPF